MEKRYVGNREKWLKLLEDILEPINHLGIREYGYEEEENKLLSKIEKTVNFHKRNRMRSNADKKMAPSLVDLWLSGVVDVINHYNLFYSNLGYDTARNLGNNYGFLSVTDVEKYGNYDNKDELFHRCALMDKFAPEYYDDGLKNYYDYPSDGYQSLPALTKEILNEGEVIYRGEWEPGGNMIILLPEPVFEDGEREALACSFSEMTAERYRSVAQIVIDRILCPVFFSSYGDTIEERSAAISKRFFV